MVRRVLFLCLPLLMCLPAFFQLHDFSRVDSLSMTVKYHNDIFRLTNELVSPWPEPLDKSRAIFRWITENIAYDCKLYNSEEKRIPSDKYEYLRKILKRKKAICGGYAALFAEMCSIAGIRCDKVSGYCKQKPHQIGSKGESHAWNALWIDSTYYLVDPTWAAGYATEKENGKLDKFHQKFNNYYWFTPAEDFYRDHYPKDPNWVVSANVPMNKYLNAPFIETYLMKKLYVIAPDSGIIMPCKGDTIHFELDYTHNIEKLQINTNVRRNMPLWVKEKNKMVEVPNALMKQSYVPYKTAGDRYYFDYVVTDQGLSYIDILFDYERVIRFKVRVRED